MFSEMSWLFYLIGIPLTVLIVLFVTFILLWIYHRLTVGWCLCTDDMTGKVVLITGGDSGLGFATAKNLGFRNCRLILASENEQNGPVAVSELVALTKNENIVFRKLDLRSLWSVRAFASEIISCEERLDVLINNAGIIGTTTRQETEDGFEMTMTVNYFGPFLLTNLLLPLIIKSSPSRIINLSSFLHKRGQLDTENMNKGFFGAYSRSKLALTIFTKELSRRMDGTGVTVNSLCPGGVHTNILKSMFPRFAPVYNAFPLPILRKPNEGAQTTIHLAVSKKLENVTGNYFVDCRIAKESQQVLDSDIGNRLWLRSAQLTSLNEENLETCSNRLTDCSLIGVLTQLH